MPETIFGAFEAGQRLRSDENTATPVRAIVTGAGGGMGRELSRRLAAQGLEVMLVGRGESSLREVANSIGDRGKVLVADLSEEAGITSVAQECPDRLDVLIHAAGVFHHGPMTDLSYAGWMRLLAVNLCAPILLSKACLPQLREAGGQVVLINSTAGFSQSLGVYGLSKQALRMAGDTLRHELKGSGVRVLHVYPGRTDTEMQVRVLQAEGRPAARIPLIPPADLAAVVMSALAAPRSLDITDLVVRPPNA